jgi:hypothetical protein
LSKTEGPAVDAAVVMLGAIIKPLFSRVSGTLASRERGMMAGAGDESLKQTRF